MANHAGESQTSPKRVYEAQGYLSKGEESPHWIQQLIEETAAPQRRGITELREKLQEDSLQERQVFL